MDVHCASTALTTEELVQLRLTAGDPRASLRLPARRLRLDRVGRTREAQLLAA